MVELKNKNEPIRHKHHIVPKHMGGTDDPCNLVIVSVEDHANLHKQLWEDLGHWQDYVAWQGLIRNIDDAEIIRLKQSYGGRQGGLKTKGILKTPEHCRKMSESARGRPSPMEGKKHSLKTLKKMKKPKSEEHRQSMKGRSGTWERTAEHKEKCRLVAIERWSKIRSHNNKIKVV